MEDREISMVDGDDGAALRRRELLAGAAGLVVATSLPSYLNHGAAARAAKVPMAREGRFAHGVASGMPSPRQITLWTRLSEITRSSYLTLEVARDRKFRRVVLRRKVLANQNRDFTVHALVKKLKPGTPILTSRPR